MLMSLFQCIDGERHLHDTAVTTGARALNSSFNTSPKWPIRHHHRVFELVPFSLFSLRIGAFFMCEKGLGETDLAQDIYS